jgi:hypothetical protein
VVSGSPQGSGDPKIKRIGLGGKVLDQIIGGSTTYGITICIHYSGQLNQQDERMGEGNKKKNWKF